METEVTIKTKGTIEDILNAIEAGKLLLFGSGFEQVDIVVEVYFAKRVTSVSGLNQAGGHHLLKKIDQKYVYPVLSSGANEAFMPDGITTVYVSALQHTEDKKYASPEKNME